MERVHESVLLTEVLEYLDPQPGKKFIDATLNGGGHAKALAARGAQVLGIEWDSVLAAKTKTEITSSEFVNAITVVNDSYVNMVAIAKAHDFIPDGILFDLGLSSWHYEGSGRGFSFKRDEPLDMRFHVATGIPASEIVNLRSMAELEQILREYGEEQFSKEIAYAITQARKQQPIISVQQLVSVIESAVPEWYKHRKINAATKTFQALRVAVNDELANVERGVNAAINLLPPGGKLVVISFQGHEDKVVRELFKKNVKAGIIKQSVKGTQRPTWEEQKANPRSRSAKMKVAEKI